LEKDDEIGNRFKRSYDALQAGKVLLPLAKEMDEADSEKSGRYVKAASRILLDNQSMGTNINTELAFKNAGLQSPLPSQRIDQSTIDLVRDIGKTKDGFFLGETHGDPETTGFVIKNAKALKAAGYNTLFLEINQDWMADLREGPEKNLIASYGKQRDQEISC
jgi:hypothetical protein